MENLSIFDLLAESKPLPGNIKLLSLFSGIGAFEKALDNLGISYELVGYCEIDKYASKSYSAIHGVSEDMNLWDVTKVDEKALPKDIDLITYGFPCQDISLAGKQKGLFNDDGTKTRSGLFFDALRIIEQTQPKVAIAENVKNLVGKKFNAQFQVVLASLEAAGYNNYWQVLNAKDYGVPQNRERVFIVSIRKDIDNGMFEFPKAFPLERRLKDVLEDTVDEKYYLSQPMIDFFEKNSEKQKANGNGFRFSPSEGDCVAKTITTRAGARMDDNFIKQVGQIYPNSGNPQAGRIYDADGISPTMDTCSGGNRMPKVVEPFISIDEDSVKVREATKQGYAEAFDGDSINLEQPNSKTRRGRVGKAVAQTLTTSPQQAVVEPMAYDEQNQYVRQDGCVGTLTTDGSSPKHNNRVLVWDGYNQRIRADQSCVGTLTTMCGADLKRHGQGIIEPINPMPDDTCRTIKSQYSFTAITCTTRTGSMGATMVSEKLPDDVPQNEKDQVYKVKDQSVKFIGKNDNVVEYPMNLPNGTFKIRKLTPKECFRLMGFDDSDFHKAELVNSNTQLYKQAGNSIVVDVLEHILKQIFKAI